jgi:hypothetical protein
MILSILGTWMILEYFIQPLAPLIPLTDTIRTYTTILASASWGLGIAVLTLHHLRNIYRKSESPFWGYSVLYVISFVAMTLAGLFGGTTGERFLWAYDNIFSPAGMALYSTTAFFITTAGFRVFRFRNLDSTILLVSGSIVLMSVLPIFTGTIPFIGPLGQWIMNVPGVAGYRAFTIGVALGIIGLGIRIFLHKHPEVLR